MGRASRRGMTPARAERAARVVELYDAGMPFHDIAKIVGVSRTQVQNDYNDAMEAARPDTARHIFDKNDRRLNRLYRKFLGKALEGNIQAGRLCLDIIREQSELWGVKGAVKVELDGTLDITAAIREQFKTLDDLPVEELLAEFDGYGDDDEDVDGED